MSEFASPDVSAWLALSARTLVAAGICALILAGCRYAVRLDTVAGKLLSVGVCVRLLAYAALFFISYLDLSFLHELHSGDGFWRVSPDARLYYDLALGIPRPDGLTLSSGAAPSPGFIHMLSAWMWAVGPGPAAAALLNVSCCVGVCLLVMKLLRGEERAMRLLVGAFTLSPALIVFGSQPLKDVLFVGLVVALCAAARFVLAERTGRRRVIVMWLNGVVLATGFFLLASIRPYYAIFLLVALATALPFAALAARPAVLRTLGRAAAILALSVAAVLTGMSADGRATIRQFSRTTLAWTLGRPSPPPIPTTVPLAAAPSIATPANVDRQTGNLAVRPAGAPTLHPAGNDALPETTTLTRDLAAGSNVMSVKDNSLLPGSVLSLEAHGQREFLYVGWVNISGVSAANNQLAFNFGGRTCGGWYFNDGKAFYIPDGPHAGWWVQAIGGCTYSAPNTVITVTGDITSDTASGHILYFEDASTTPSSYQYVAISRAFDGSGASHAWKAGDAVSSNRAPAGLSVPARMLLTLDRARQGFLSTGGRTDFGGGVTPTGGRGRIEATLRGAAAMWIPIFFLRPLGVLDVGPLTGFLAIAELDTVFNAGVLLAVGLMLWRGRARFRSNTWYLAFLVVIVVLTGLGLAYVMTNFGTLFRMRLMVMVPLWMTLLGLAGTPAPQHTAAVSSEELTPEPR